MATTPTWPASLPAPLLSSGYGYQRADAGVRTTMDSGKIRARRRFITVPTTVTLSWRMTRAQLAAFEAWWADDLSDGFAWAQIPVINGAGKNNILGRFTGPAKVAGVDGNPNLFDASASVETMAMPGST